MRHLILSAALILIYGLVFFSGAQQQGDAPEGWVKISICHISFFAPSDMKDLGTKGLDSCIAQFGNNQMTLYLDYGRYGSPDSQSNWNREFKKQTISIDGKEAQLATYIIDDTHYVRNSGQRYSAGLYVVVKQAESQFDEDLPTALMMSVHGESEKEQEIAERIFRTIRFE